MKLSRERLRRLGEMTWKEIGFRSRQQLSVLSERLVASWLPSNGDTPWWSAWDLDAVRDEQLRQALKSQKFEHAVGILPQYFRGRATPRFFFSRSDLAGIREMYRRCFPARVERIRESADRICEHRFQIFGYPEVQCGPEIPWRSDMVFGKESGLEHWSEVRYLDFESVGDSKIVWEPNRHQHFFTLGQAFVLTGDERYASEAVRQWQSWTRQNPYARGINWASSLEVAFRSWSWIWMLFLLQESKSLTGEALAGVISGLGRNAEFISANLSTYFSPNTHLLGEGFSLFVTGLLFPELRNARVWLQAGRDILIEQMDKQVRPDGSHLEQSASYHLYATDFFLLAALLSDRNGNSFPQAYRARLTLMLEFLKHLTQPSGLLPTFGDYDGGQLCLLGPRTPHDPSVTLTTGALYLERKDLLPSGNENRDETLWFYGPTEQKRAVELGESDPATQSRIFADAGLVTMRSAWDRDARFLAFDAGPQGMSQCAHGHADALSIVCSADGVDWLVDPGTYVYSASPEWRAYFRSTRAHNTVSVDGRDQAQAVDLFKFREIPEVRLETCATFGSFDVAIASHMGYAKQPEPVLHRRCVFFGKPDYWVVFDEFAATGEHNLEIPFHFGPRVQLSEAEHGWRACADEKILRLVSTAPVQWRKLRGGEPQFSGNEPAAGWYSPDYGTKVPSDVLLASFNGPLNTGFPWLLSAGEKELNFGCHFESGRMKFSIESDLWQDEINVAQSPAGSPDALPSISSIVFSRRNSQGDLQYLAATGSQSAEIDGQSMLESKDPIQQFEFRRNGEVGEVRSTKLGRLRLRLPDIQQINFNGTLIRAVRDGDWLELPGSN